MTLKAENEARSYEQSFVQKQKRVLVIAKQLNALLLKYTSPENVDNSLISDSDFKNLKSALTHETHTLESDVKTHSKDMEQWINKRTYNFARYASTWFAHGILETKRTIFACLGSNLILKDRNIDINLHKPFRFIFDNLPDAERELVEVRTPENPLYKGQDVISMSEMTTVRDRQD